MPPKSVTCSVCSTVVLKAQTLARADGSRACRAHGDVAAEAEALRTAERERLERETTTRRRKPWERSAEEMQREREVFAQQAAAFRERVYSHCWICDEEGVGLQEFYLNALVAMKRLELRGEFDFFNLPADVARLTGKQRALGMLELKGEAIDRAIVKHIRNRNMRDIVPLLRCVLLCPECARKHGFRERWDALFPRPTFEQIMDFMPVTMAIDPLLTEIAERKERQS